MLTRIKTVGPLKKAKHQGFLGLLLFAFCDSELAAFAFALLCSSAHQCEEYQGFYKTGALPGSAVPQAIFPSAPSGFRSLARGIIGCHNWKVQEKTDLTANFAFVSLTICDLSLPLYGKDSK